MAVDAVGLVYWTQEDTNSASDITFALGVDGVPQATQLSTTAIIAELNAPSNATGDIQSIAAGADGGIYFYFSGGAKAGTLAALGRFDPASGEVRILADTAAIRAATRMGADLSLARGTLVPTRGGKQIWLWLRHSDRSLLFRFDAETTPPVAARFPLNQPFRRVVLPAERKLSAQAEIAIDSAVASSEARPASGAATQAEPVELALTSESQSLGPGGDDGSLLLLDAPASMLRRIHPETGVATDLLSLTGLPSALSQPTADLRAGAPPGRVLLFAADSDPLPARSAEQAGVDSLVGQVNLPALFTFDPPRVESIVEAGMLRARSGFPIRTLALQQLVYAGEGNWIAYDAGTGELLRLHH